MKQHVHDDRTVCTRAGNCACSAVTGKRLHSGREEGQRPTTDRPLVSVISERQSVHGRPRCLLPRDARPLEIHDNLATRKDDAVRAVVVVVARDSALTLSSRASER